MSHHLDDFISITSDPAQMHPNSLSRQINEDVRPYIDLIDGLRMVGIEKDLSIPCIVAMGDQSSGKSSVLEQLSGVEFPRGTGLVTRCPTELQMKNTPNDKWKGRISLKWDRDQPEEAGDLKSPEEIGDKILELTKLITDGQCDIQSEYSILLEISSLDHPDLTIIDLPGIVRNQMPGQSETVVSDVDKLIQRYLEQDRTVILAVVPMNVDIATVDIIQRAVKVDPEGKRTVGVLTKPDSIGQGEERGRIDVLKNLTMPLKLGYTAVLNRSQAQIDQKISLAAAKICEQEFFQNNRFFREVDPRLVGGSNLACKLSQILFDRIKEAVPELNKEIDSQLISTEAELMRLGDPPPTGQVEMRSALMGILRDVTRDIKSAVNGLFGSETFLKRKDLRVHAQFNKFVQEFEKEIVKLRPEWDVDEIKKINSEMRGRALAGFLNASVFDHFVRQFVQEWKNPLHKLLDDSNDITLSACKSIIDYHVPKYKIISFSLKSTIEKIMGRRANHAKFSKDGLDFILSNESVPSTSNNRFIKLCDEQKQKSFESFLHSSFDRMPHSEAEVYCKDEFFSLLKYEYKENYSIGSELTENRDAEVLKGILQSYWSIASERFIDVAKRSVDRLLWEDIDVEFENEFIKKINQVSKLDEMFYQNLGEHEKRIQLNSKLERLRIAGERFRGIGI